MSEIISYEYNLPDYFYSDSVKIDTECKEKIDFLMEKKDSFYEIVKKLFIYNTLEEHDPHRINGDKVINVQETHFFKKISNSILNKNFETENHELFIIDGMSNLFNQLLNKNIIR